MILPGDAGSQLSPMHDLNNSPATSIFLKQVAQKHPVYWFDDGSIILHVHNTIFRIHHTLLSRHSPFLATSNNSGTLLEGEKNALASFGVDIAHYRCSYVLVEPSRHATVQDVEVLLQHFYHDVPLASSASFDRVASILRITSPGQLDFPEIHAFAKDLFRAMFPTGPRPFSHPPSLHEALDLATKFQITSVRKALLYSLVTTTHFDTEQKSDSDLHSGDLADPPTPTSFESAAPGQVISDMNEPTPSDPIAVIGLPPPVSLIEADVCTLSDADLKLCNNLMSRLIDHFTPILFTPAATPHMACTDVFADTWMPLVIQLALEDDGVYKPLETLERIKDIDWAKLGLCASCIVEKREEWAEEQMVVWKLMDDWLGIDSVKESVDAV